MLECVINISEGGNPGQLSDLSSELGPDLLDLHSDADHNRSVRSGPSSEEKSLSWPGFPPSLILMTHSSILVAYRIRDAQC